MREQSSSALRSRLVREGFPEGAACAAVERAVACGLVDDRRYADVLVRSRLAQGRGRRGHRGRARRRRHRRRRGGPARRRSGGSVGRRRRQDEIERALELLERRPPACQEPAPGGLPAARAERLRLPRWPPRRRACGASNRRPGAARGFRRAAPGGGAGCAFRQCWHLSPPHPRAPSAGAPSAPLSSRAERVEGSRDAKDPSTRSARSG